MRILFDDKEACLEKFRTCARLREFENQTLDAEFYQIEHSKPLLINHSITNVRNIYTYHCTNELFKILKFITPMGMFELFILFNRNGKETRLITSVPSANYFFQAGLILNVVRDLLKIYDFTLETGPIKLEVKRTILEIQSGGNPMDWHHGSWNTL